MENLLTDKKCIWCLETEPDVTFIKKAHTILETETVIMADIPLKLH
jgi:hypothetical protein